MIKYPGIPKAYPAALKQYPAAARVYPGSSLLSFPSSGAVVPPNPLEILGSDAAFWLPPYVSTGITLTSGAVSQRTNLGSDTTSLPYVEQATAASRPTIYTFRGTDAYWQRAGGPTFLRAPATFTTIPQPFTWIFSFKTTEWPQTGSQVLQSGGAGTSSIQLIDGRSWRMAATTNQTYTNCLPATPHAGWMACKFSGATSQGYLDNVGLGVINPGTQGMSDFFWGRSAAGTSPCTMSIGDIILVKRALTQPEMDALHTWFQYANHIGEPEQTFFHLGASQDLGTGSTDTLGQRWRCFHSGPTGVPGTGWGYQKVGGVWLQQVGPLGSRLWPGDAHGCQIGDNIAALKARALAQIGTGNVYQPDIVGGMAGGNNILAGDSAATVTAALQDLWNTVFTQLPTAAQVIRTVSNMGPAVGAPALAELAAYQASVPGVVAALQGGGVPCINEDNSAHVGAYNVTDWDADGIHYKDSGHDKSVLSAPDGEGLYNAIADATAL